MYSYNSIDQAIVDARVNQFAEQMERYLGGALSDEQFAPLRLQNGLYLQRHAPMLRVAIPYGTLASYQLRKLADIARQDEQFMEVAEVYRDDPAFDVQKLVEELVKGEHVPLLPDPRRPAHRALLAPGRHRPDGG